MRILLAALLLTLTSCGEPNLHQRGTAGGSGGSGGFTLPPPGPGEPGSNPPVETPPAPARPDAAAPPTPDAGAPPVTTPPPGPADAAAPPVDTAPAPPPPPMGTWWKPAIGSTWDWQLQSPIDPGVDVQVIDIDAFENSAATIADLHARGRKVICYINVGVWESWRPDAASFPEAVLGEQAHDNEDEKWLDIRRTDVLGPIMRNRIAMADEKGCDAIEPDNVDGWDTAIHEPTGFPLTATDQALYARFIARIAHERGMAVGLKNNFKQAGELVGDFDFHISEQCYEFNTCQQLQPFLDAGKPVFAVEYELPLETFCPLAKAARISAIRKTPLLDAWREPCP